MTYKVEDYSVSEEPELPIFDRDGREYRFEVNYFYDKFYKCNAIHIFLLRKARNCRVGKAYCLFYNPESLELADIVISNSQDFLSINDKIFKLFHWNEPSNYRRKGLGTVLLKFIIELGKKKGLTQISGTLVEQDISDNPNLVRWLQAHEFRIEPPLPRDEDNVVHRATLYL